jgi:pimeloyl-ACP methyl ester carboxylesterase
MEQSGMRSTVRTSFVLLGLAAALAGCQSFGPPMTGAAVGVERWRSDLVRKEITVPDGTRFVYLEGGSGEPLVLVHGFGADKDHFTRVARWLTPHYRVIVPDLVGFGESTHLLDADYHYAAQAGRLHDFVQALGLKRVHLGGNSMGGAIVMSYAAQHPQEVGSLWLMDAAGVADAPPGELARILAQGGRNPLIVTTEGDFDALMKFGMSEPPYVPGPMRDVLAEQRIANQELERKVFQQIATDSVSGTIKGLSTPTLIVWGAEDRVLSAGSVPLLQALLPQSQAIVMPHVGHAPMIERPQQSAEDYLRFRAGLGQTVSQ